MGCMRVYAGCRLVYMGVGKGVGCMRGLGGV